MSVSQNVLDKLRLFPLMALTEPFMVSEWKISSMKYKRIF